MKSVLIVSTLFSQCAIFSRSRSISEVKQLQAGLVLGWVTAWESPVPYPFVTVFTFAGFVRFIKYSSLGSSEI